MLRRGPISAGTGTDHKEIAKHNRKKVVIETAVRKRMMENTSEVISFNRVRKEGHEGCQRDQLVRWVKGQENKGDRKYSEHWAIRYRYANCSLGHC